MGGEKELDEVAKDLRKRNLEISRLILQIYTKNVHVVNIATHL